MTKILPFNKDLALQQRSCPSTKILLKVSNSFPLPANSFWGKLVGLLFFFPPKRYTRTYLVHMFPNMSGKKREEEFQRKMQSIMEKPRELATSARHDTDYEDPFITYNPLILTFDPNFQR